MPPVGAGFGLGVVYAAQVLSILILYPLCRWFATVTRQANWMRRGDFNDAWDSGAYEARSERT